MMNQGRTARWLLCVTLMLALAVVSSVSFAENRSGSLRAPGDTHSFSVDAGSDDLVELFFTYPKGSVDFWVKVVEMLQQNWALIEPEQAGGVRVYFITDRSGVFDEIAFSSEDEACKSLSRNGFRHFAEDAHLQSFLRPPSTPFFRAHHPNGAIYSSGAFWRS